MVPTDGGRGVRWSESSRASVLVHEGERLGCTITPRSRLACVLAARDQLSISSPASKRATCLVSCNEDGCALSSVQVEGRDHARYDRSAIQLDHRHPMALDHQIEHRGDAPVGDAEEVSGARSHSEGSRRRTLTRGAMGVVVVVQPVACSADARGAPSGFRPQSSSGRPVQL